MNDNTRAMGTQPLPLGHKLLWYTIEEVLGQGGFGLTYLATDTNLNRQVAIKEYLPSIFAYRDSDYTVSPLTGDHGDNYSWGLTSFLNEARTLAKFRHRNIVAVQTVFEEHNTAYMVMEYEHGESLDQIFKSRIDSLDQAFFENMLFPVMDGLQQIHDAGFIHRDIKPGNLYLRNDGSPVLIDFGSARQTSQQDTGEMTTLVSQGYTPLEQYSSNFGDQGPWTDIYSFAASVYHGILGKRSEDALNRSAALLSGKPDPLKQLVEQSPPGYSSNFCHALDCALLLKPAERPQTLGQWRELFSGDSSVTVSRPLDTVAPPVDDDATRILTPASRRPVDDFPEATRTSPPLAARSDAQAVTTSKTPMLAGIGLLAIALAGGGWWFSQQGGGEQPYSVTAAVVSSLPKPSESITIATPVDRLTAEIFDLKALSSAYQEALSLDAESPEAKEGLNYVVSSYKNLAASPAMVSNASLRRQLSSALEAIAPDADGSVKTLLDKLTGDNTQASIAWLEPLLNKKTLTDTEQQQLIFGLAALSDGDKAKAAANAQVVQLNSQFKQAIVRASRDSQFEQASHMLELALLVSPRDDGLLMLKAHLENGG